MIFARYNDTEEIFIMGEGISAEHALKNLRDNYSDSHYSNTFDYRNITFWEAHKLPLTVVIETRIKATE